MLQKLIAILLGRHSIESALFHFNKAIDLLNAVEKQEVAEIESRKVEIEQAQAALADATRKATIARNKAAKLRTFIGEDDADANEPNLNTLRAIA